MSLSRPSPSACTLGGLISVALTAMALAAPARAEVPVGLLAGISGPIAAMAPAMVEASRMAIDEINAAGGIGKGEKIALTVADSACNPQAGTDGATKLVNITQVRALIGPHCSGATLAAANSVAVPAGVTLVSPSASSPALTTLDDRDLVFRTLPSDAWQGAALARTLLAQGTDTVAVAYLNNDYGKGLAEAFRDEFKAHGGKVRGYSGHEGGKASYRAELAALAAAGADTLMIFDYGDGSGLTLLRQALENGFFRHFVGGDGMKSDAVIHNLGAENLGDFRASSPVGEDSDGLTRFNKAFAKRGQDPAAIFATTSYDAAFLVALALEQNGGAREGLSEALRKVAGPPGVRILPGEWKKAKKLIAQGKDIDYSGASGALDFDAAGDVPGTYALFKVAGEGFERIATLK